MTLFIVIAILLGIIFLSLFLRNFRSNEKTFPIRDVIELNPNNQKENLTLKDLFGLLKDPNSPSTKEYFNATEGAQISALYEMLGDKYLPQILELMIAGEAI